MAAPAASECSQPLTVQLLYVRKDIVSTSCLQIYLWVGGWVEGVPASAVALPPHLCACV